MDGTNHVEAGGGGGVAYTAKKPPLLSKKDLLKTLIDVVFFDTSSNMQKDGRVLTANDP